MSEVFRGLVSSDSHVNEPRDLWSANLPSSMRESAMRGIAMSEDGGWDLILEGRHVGKAGSSEEDRLKVVEPAHRLAVMREEGIACEVIFPTIGLYVWMLKDPDGGKMSCRIYNEWIHDQLESKSPRFRCAGLVPTWRIEDALEEVEFIASSGLAAVMLPVVGPTSYNRREWAPLWAAIAETGLPIVMHQGTGHDLIWYRGPGATVANSFSSQTMGPRTATMFSTSGILERHPELHVVFVEFNTGWLAWMMETIDFVSDRLSRYGTTDNLGSAKLAGEVASPKPVIYPELAEPPSFYIRRQVHSTFQEEVVGLRNVAATGPGCLLWGSDYPHEEGTYPRTREVVERLWAELDEATAARIFRDNGAELFGFGPDVLSTPA